MKTGGNTYSEEFVDEKHVSANEFLGVEHEIKDDAEGQCCPDDVWVTGGSNF